MTPDSFIAFLSAYIELNPNTPPTAAQWAIINAKLDSCFDKRTPDRAVGAPTTPHVATTDGARIIPQGTSDNQTRPFYIATGDNWKGMLTGVGDMGKFTFSNVATTC